MTLCIVHQIDEQYFFLSDSRLTDVTGDIITNDATKIFNIDVKVEVENSPCFQTTYGVCFSGSYLYASLIIETLEQFLSNIQTTDTKNCSFENIFTLVQKVINHLLNNFFAKCPKFDFEMMIGGWCPCDEKFKFKKIKIEREKDNATGEVKGLKLETEDLDLPQNVYFIGTEEVQNAVQGKVKNDKISYIKALKSAIDDEKYNTVGGAIQIGVFKEKRFEIVGYSISEPVEKNNNPSVEDYYVFRGFKFKINELYDEKYVFTKKFALPFDKERDKLFKDALNKTYSMLGL